MTNPDYHESDRTGEAHPLDADPAVPNLDADTADTIGVPVGSAGPAGESEFVDGAEVGGEMEEDDQSAGNPITPAGAFNETNTEG